jgi:nitrous oxidase accessory protein NosD
MKNTSHFAIYTGLMARSVVILTLCGSLALAQTPSAPDSQSLTDTRSRVLLVDDDKSECPNAGFTEIQAAVNVAAPGDTIHVCPGTYAEQVEIAKPLRLVGIERNGKDAVVVQPSNVRINAEFSGFPYAAIILVRDTSEVSLTNITIDGSNNGLVCDATSPTVDGVFFLNASGEADAVAIRNILSPQACAFADGIDIITTDERAQRVTIRNSSLHDYDFVGIFALGSHLSVAVTNTVLTGRGPTELPDFGQAGVQFVGGATGAIEGNVVTNHITADPTNAFVAHGIGVFNVAAGEVRIVRNIVGTSNVGIFMIDSNKVVAQDNTVVNALRTGIDAGGFVGGEANVVQDNTITNVGFATPSDRDAARRGAIFVLGTNNRILHNTINEAFIGLVVTAGNHIGENTFLNTRLTQQVFVPPPSADSSGASSNAR